MHMHIYICISIFLISDFSSGGESTRQSTPKARLALRNRCRHANVYKVGLVCSLFPFVYFFLCLFCISALVVVIALSLFSTRRRTIPSLKGSGLGTEK